MAKPEWGVKRVCKSCAAKFYDLGRSPIACPKCGAAFDPEPLLKSRRSRPVAPAKATKPETKPVKAEGTGSQVKSSNEDVGADPDKADEAVPDLSDGDADDTVIEDGTEPGEDDDISKVVVTGDGEDN